MSWRYYNTKYSSLLGLKGEDYQEENATRLPYNQTTAQVNFPDSENLYASFTLVKRVTSFDRIPIIIHLSKGYLGLFGPNNKIYRNNSDIEYLQNFATDTYLPALLTGEESKIWLHLTSDKLTLLVNKTQIEYSFNDYFSGATIRGVYFSDGYGSSNKNLNTLLKNIILSDELISTTAYLKEITPQVAAGDGWTVNNDGTYSTTETGKILTCSLPKDSTDLANLKILDWTPIAKEANGGANVSKLNISGTSYLLGNAKTEVGGFVGTDKTIITEKGVD